MTSYVRCFEDITLDDLPLVGGKNASLGEMWRSLRPLGVKVPPGFAVTAEAYLRLLEVGRLRERLVDLMAGLDVRDSASLADRARREPLRRRARHHPPVLELRPRPARGRRRVGPRPRPHRGPGAQREPRHLPHLRRLPLVVATTFTPMTGLDPRRRA